MRLREYSPKLQQSIFSYSIVWLLQSWLKSVRTLSAWTIFSFFRAALLVARRLAYFGALCAFLLCLLCVLWEGWLSPARPGGSWLILKGLPIFLTFRGLIRENRYTAQWGSMLVLIYWLEGAVRMFDPKITRVLALIELILSFTLFGVLLSYARITAPSQQNKNPL